MAIDVGSAIGYLELDTSKFTQGFSSALKDLKGFNDKTLDTNTRLKKLGSGMTNIGSTLNKNVTAPILALGTASVAAASEFDSAMTNIQSSTRASADEMSKFDAVLSAVYKNNYGEGFEDISNALITIREQLGSLGEKEMQNVTESALAFRDAFGYDVPESIRSVNTLMTNFGITSEEAFDLMTNGIQNGLDFSGELLDNIKEYSVQFKKVGLDAEDMFNIFASGAESGAWNLDKIGDAVKEFSIRAIDGSETTEHGFQVLGMNAEEMGGKIAKGGEEARKAFDQVLKALADMDNPMMQSIAGVELFGTMWEDLGPEVVTQLTSITSSADGAKGAMEDLKATRYEDFQSSLESLKRSISLVAVDIGTVLIPYVQKFVDWLSQVFNKFGEMDEGTRKILVTLSVVIAAIGPVLTIVGKGITLFTTLKSGIAGVQAALAAAGTSLGAVLGPIAAVIAAVVTIIAIFKRLYDTSDTFRDKVDTMVSNVTTKFGELKEKIQPILEKIGDALATAFEKLAPIFEGVLTVVINIFSALVDALGPYIDTFGSYIDYIVNLVSAWYALFTGDFDTFKTKMIEAFKSLGDVFLGLGKTIWTFVESFVSSFGVDLKDALSDFTNNVKTFFTEKVPQAIDDMVAWFKKLPERIWQALLNVITKVVSWRIQMTAKAIEVGKTFVTNVINFFKELPSKVWEVIKGIPDKIKALNTLLREAGKALFNALWEGMKSVWTSITSWFSGVLEKIKDVFNAVKDGINDAKFATTPSSGSHANGLNYVPYDGYRATLHKGERVLTKSEAEQYGRTQSGGDTYNFYNVDPNPYEYAQQMKRAKIDMDKGYA